MYEYSIFAFPLRINSCLLWKFNFQNSHLLQGELKGKLNRAEIIDCTKVECDKANFGTVVTLLDLDTQKKITYQLLGPDDADFDTGSISIHSPIGSAIIGCMVGEKISVELPRGVRNLEVVDITKPFDD